MVATTTSNRSILLTQICWSFPLPVFYRSSAEHPHKTSNEYVCLNLYAFVSKNLQQFSSSFTLAGWIPGALPCQRANCDSVRHCLFSIFAAKPIPLSATWGPNGWVLSSPHHKLLISILEKLNLFRLTGVTTLVLLM